MYIDRNAIDEYPFTGEFYTLGDDMPSDGNMLGDEGNAEETVVAEVNCDIINSNKVFSSGSYLNVYFPFDKSEGIVIYPGVRFRSSDWYRSIDGVVQEVIPTQMGGCEVTIKEVGVE